MRHLFSNECISLLTKINQVLKKQIEFLENSTLVAQFIGSVLTQYSQYIFIQ